MDREDIRDAVQEILGEATADFWGETQLDLRISEAQRRFLAAERWPWLVTEGTGQLTADDPDLELQEGVAATRHLNITLIPESSPTRRYTPRRLSAVQGFSMRNLYTSNTQYPEYFYVTSVADSDDNGQYTYVAKFVGTPSASMDVEYQYFRAGQTFDGDNDVPDMPEEFHMALVHYVAARCWEKELGPDASKAREQDSLYAFILDQARTEWLQQPEDTPLIVGSEPPEYGGTDIDTYTRMRIPEVLG